MINLPLTLDPIIKILIQNSCRPVVVGGFVRDALLGIPSKDIDIEVFGIESLERLEALLLPYGEVNSVGKSFGVVKLQLPDIEVDFSIPRQEEKSAAGHRGFDVTLNSTLCFEDAAIRRDFTINAMGYDLQERRVLDPFGGEDDLRKRRLKVVNAETFVEDPLRLYRAVQFAARFELTATPELITLAREMVAENMLDELPKERLFEELKKLLVKSEKPSIGFTLMDTFGILELFPELKALKNLPQDPIYHPEGDVWVHTLMVLDAMTKLHGDDDKKNLCLSLAALCHDLGKATTTEVVDGHVRAIGHEMAGLALTERFLARISDEKRLVESVLPLVKNHLKPMQFYKQGAKSAAIRRLANEVNIEELVLLAKADFLGRGTQEALKGVFKGGEWLEARAKELHVSTTSVTPLLQGRDLVKAGLTPSKSFKQILEMGYEAQMDGVINTHLEAVEWLENFLKSQ